MLRKGCVSVLLLALVSSGLTTPYNLGTLQFHTGAPSGPLLQKMIAPSAVSQGSLASYSFVGKVGDVAFAGVAKPEPGIQPSAVSIAYDSSQPDGTRLFVTLDGTTGRAMIPDWMLVPIARYSDSEFNACVSLFGTESTDAQYDIVYHPAFLNTLIGLRLLQADILLFDLSNTWNLPEINGETPLGLGERKPTAMREDAAIAIQNAIALGKFQSWVFTDGNSETLFAFRSGEIRFVGNPYYYFWTSDMAGYQREHNALLAQAFSVREDVARYNEIVARANALEPRVSPVPSLTDPLRRNSQSLSDFNPAVYNAALNTMRYSASFRFVKARNPAGWAAFLEQIREVTPRPAVETPTKWPR